MHHLLLQLIIEIKLSPLLKIFTKQYQLLQKDLTKLTWIDEFATHNDSLEEIFENKEQIEVSKFYERLPKPHAMAIEEWLNEKIYHRKTDEAKE